MTQASGGPGSNQSGQESPRPGSPQPAPSSPAADALLPGGAVRSQGRKALVAHAEASPDITRCPADPDYAVETIRGRVSDHHDYVMFAASRGQWAQALASSYDAARQAVSMLLLHDGWRVPDQARGKHLVLAEAAAVWLSAGGGNGPRLAKSFQSSRKARNNFEYPDSQAPLPAEHELRGMTLDNARIVELARQEVGLSRREDAVPNDENITKWQSQT